MVGILLGVPRDSSRVIPLGIPKDSSRDSSGFLKDVLRILLRILKDSSRDS